MIGICYGLKLLVIIWNWAWRKDIGLFYVEFLSCEWLVNDLLMFKVANLDFEWLYKTVELRMGIWVVTYEYERDVKVL